VTPFNPFDDVFDAAWFALAYAGVTLLPFLLPPVLAACWSTRDRLPSGQRTFAVLVAAAAGMRLSVVLGTLLVKETGLRVFFISPVFWPLGIVLVAVTTFAVVRWRAGLRRSVAAAVIASGAGGAMVAAVVATGIFESNAPLQAIRSIVTYRHCRSVASGVREGMPIDELRGRLHDWFVAVTRPVPTDYEVWVSDRPVAPVDAAMAWPGDDRADDWRSEPASGRTVWLRCAVDWHPRYSWLNGEGMLYRFDVDRTGAVERITRDELHFPGD
jgi:hypothetical protein